VDAKGTIKLGETPAPHGRVGIFWRLKTMDIKAGDVVKLKSGGPKMTVEKIGLDSSGNATTFVQCCWFNAQEEAK
jgi:uncharacterized protein YodC (DUF2158 family)